MRRWLRMASLLTLSACPESPAATQFAVWISADGALAAQLVAVRVELFRAGGGEREPAVATHTFALADPSGPVPPLLFSFGIADSGPGTFTLAARGCSDSEACERPLIEHEVRVRFEPQKTLRIHLHLDRACAAEDARCPGFERTCRPSRDEPWRGQCVEVPWAKATPIEEADTEPPRLPAPPVVEHDCATEAACRDPYPCVAPGTDAPVCEGQFATWSMPDSRPGSRTPPSYDVRSTPGVVYDESTGLTWQRALPETYAGCKRGRDRLGEACTWSEARDYCQQLELAGLHWRLPTFIELASLVDHRREVLTLPLETFSITTQDAYWSASPVNIAESPEPKQYFAWAFSTGRFALFDRAEGLQLRCVHALEPGPAGTGLAPAHYSHRESEDLIHDNYTNLVWRGSVLCRRDLSFAEAEDYCSGLSYRMRVPSLKELITLLDPMVARERTDPRVAHVGPLFMAHATDGYFWTSTESKQFAGNYLLWFGFPDVQDETTLPSVRDAVDRALTALASDDDDAGAGAGESAQSLLCVRCVQ